MKEIYKSIAWGAFAATSLVGLGGCGDGDESFTAALMASQRAAAAPQLNSKVQGCDAIRRKIRRDAIKQFGFTYMLEDMKRMSREVSNEEREDLRRLTQVQASREVDPEMLQEAAHSIEGIYAAAMDRAGVARGTAQSYEEIHRKVTAGPLGIEPLTAGFTLVASSSPTPATAPVAGDITEAYLGVGPDQAKYEFVLMKIKTVTQGANNGSTITGDFVSMSQYIESVLPKACANTGTALVPDQLNYE